MVPVLVLANSFIHFWRLGWVGFLFSVWTQGPGYMISWYWNKTNLYELNTSWNINNGQKLIFLSNISYVTCFNVSYASKYAEHYIFYWSMYEDKLIVIGQFVLLLHDILSAWLLICYVFSDLEYLAQTTACPETISSMPTLLLLINKGNFMLCSQVHKSLRIHMQFSPPSLTEESSCHLQHCMTRIKHISFEFK